MVLLCETKQLVQWVGEKLQRVDVGLHRQQNLLFIRISSHLRINTDLTIINENDSLSTETVEYLSTFTWTAIFHVTISSLVPLSFSSLLVPKDILKSGIKGELNINIKW